LNLQAEFLQARNSIAAHLWNAKYVTSMAALIFSGSVKTYSSGGN